MTLLAEACRRERPRCIALWLIPCLALLVACSGHHRSSTLTPPAGPVDLRALRLVDGSHPAAPSRLTLLAFLDGSAPTRDTPSKQQIPAIRSMATQFGPRGLSVRYVIANQSTATPGERTSALNLAADWQLTAPPLQLTRTELASLLAQFRITTLPATVLISTDAAHPHIWLGRVGPAQLGPAVSQASS